MRRRNQSCCGLLAEVEVSIREMKGEACKDKKRVGEGGVRTPDAATVLFLGTEEWNSPVTDCGLADMMIMFMFSSCVAGIRYSFVPLSLSFRDVSVFRSCRELFLLVMV